MATSCAQAEEWIERAIDGTLDAHAERAFQRHLAGCARCRRRYELEQRAAAGLQSLESHEPPGDLLPRVMGALPGLSPQVLGRLADVLRRAGVDLDLRRRLRQEPQLTLRSMHVDLPAGMRVEVTAVQPAPLPTPELLYLPLPETPLRFEEQEQRLAAMGLGALFGFWW